MHESGGGRIKVFGERWPHFTERRGRKKRLRMTDFWQRELTEATPWPTEAAASGEAC